MKNPILIFTSAALLSMSAGAVAQEKPESVSALQMIEMFEKLGGKHPGLRKAHASGVCAAASFSPNPEIANYSTSGLFSSESIQAVVRFSMGSANPAANETAPGARGMAVQMTLSDGSKHTIAGNNTPFFTGKDPETFYGFLQTLLPDENGVSDPSRTGAYIAANPSVLNAVRWSQTNPVPSSYAREKYFGIHTFFMVDGNGKETKFRWVLTPDLGEQDLAKEAIEDHPKLFLKDRLLKDVSDGEVSFTLSAIIGAEEDPVNDPSVAWPEERESMVLGKLSITSAGGDACDPVNFDPNIVSAGFKTSDDPVLKMRSPAYAISMGKRLSNQ